MSGLNTQKTKLEQEKKRLATILDSIGDGVFVTDTQGNITLMNKAAEKLTDFTVQESLGKHYSKIFDFVLGGNVPFYSLVEDVIKTGQVQEFARDALLIQRGGSKIPVANSIAILKNENEEIFGCVVVLRDVTHEKEVDRAKTEFISLASHQLRTPLSTINWYVELLLSGETGSLTDEQRTYLEEAYTGGQRMAKLVNALLNVSRIESGTYMVEPEPVDVVKLLHAVLDELKPQIEKKKLHITLEEQEIPIISLDPNLTNIILQNLITNAIKYSNEGGSVTVSLKLLSHPRNGLLIQVADMGMGIPKAQQSKIFTKLFRADNALRTDTEGTGLGLYLTKGLIERSDGRIWFESEENKRTVFYVTLPLSGMVRKEGTRRLT